MAYSMTGFGRGEKVFESRRYTVELKSVNSRFCDINIRMPRIFNFAETELRKMITEGLGRGKVDVFINFEDSANAAAEIVPNLALAKAYSDAIAEVARSSGRPDDLSATKLSTFQDVLVVRTKGIDEDTQKEELKATLKCAIEGMLEMRKKEASVLTADLLQKIEDLAVLREEIAERAPGVVADYKERLSKRMDDILSSEQREVFDETRLAAEVCIFADKCAIDEELKRLESHFKQARTILASEGLIGKKMDFLVQEINREVNTIGSKANDIEITNRVMACKNIVEAVREQVQNLA